MVDETVLYIKAWFAIHNGAKSITETIGSHKAVDGSVLLSGDRKAF